MKNLYGSALVFRRYATDWFSDVAPVTDKVL